MPMFKRLLLSALLLLVTAAPAVAQLNLSYTTFTPQSTISSSQFTSNFTNIDDKALNRYAAVLKGDLDVDTDAAYDVGASGTRFKDGFFSGTVTATTLTQTSDRRLKKDIVPLPTTLGIEFIDKLKPVEFGWKDPKLPGTYYGFIAQDLQALQFKGVDARNPKRLGLRVTDLIAPLVKAVQEVHEELHAVIMILEGQQKQMDVLGEKLEKMKLQNRRAE
jgi:hypothetical protein